MKSRRKRFFKRLFKLAKIPLLIGLGLIMGLALSESAQTDHHSVIVRTDGRFADEIAQNIERRVEQQIEERIIERVVIRDAPEIPPMPEMPVMPDFQTNVHIERGLSFWDLVNGVRTVLASLIMIGLGIMILMRRRREPKEKSPESMGA